ncbi:MAG TPA: CHAT domain-containing protein, partial [bacterium]|nr:CHAT domain-containing protein [bacterium]
MSLARGFTYSGCPSVVMSLWSIDDKATSVIITDFYKKLAQGKTKDVALRDAKLNMIQSGDPVLSNPYYWSGLVVIGSTESLEIPPPENFISYRIYATVVIVSILVLLILIGKKRMKSVSH